MTGSVKIIEHGYVVTCDLHNRVGPFALLIKDDRIAEMSNRPENFRARFPNAEIIDAAEKVILPGFVDAHYHGESFVLRNWTASAPMAKWQKYPPIQKALSFVSKNASKDELLPLYRTAYFSALKSGITTIAEFGFDNLDTPLTAAYEAMKRSDLKGFIGLHNGEQIERSKSLLQSTIRFGIVLPAEEELTVYNLQSTLRFAQEWKLPVIVHLGETRRGLEALKRNFHRSVARVLEEYRLFAQPVQLTHLSTLEPGDEDILARGHVPIIVNPGSALAKGTEQPKIEALLERGMTLALGSDWGAPNPFENMRMFNAFVNMQRGEPIDSSMLLAMHTTNAARALGMQMEIGSIEIGKKADLTFLNASDLRLQHLFHYGNVQTALKNLLSTASSRDVTDVMINGEFFLRQGNVMTYAEEDLKREFRQAIETIMARTGQQIREPDDQEPVSQATILTLTPDTAQPATAVPDGQANLMDEPIEEGFRVVKRNEPPPARPEPPSGPAAPRTTELSKNVKRIFGDDDF